MGEPTSADRIMLELRPYELKAAGALESLISHGMTETQAEFLSIIVDALTEYNRAIKALARMAPRERLQ